MKAIGRPALVPNSFRNTNLVGHDHFSPNLAHHDQLLIPTQQICSGMVVLRQIWEGRLSTICAVKRDSIMSRHRILVATLFFVTACASTSATSSSTSAAPDLTTTTTVATTAAPVITAAPATTTTAAADAAPPELEGVWQTDLGNGDRVQLNLRGNDYIITRGPNSGSGDISVDGGLIVFSGSNLCSGVGTYQWSVEGDSLTFTPTESGDPCSGRRPVLDGVTYTR